MSGILISFPGAVANLMSSISSGSFEDVDIVLRG